MKRSSKKGRRYSDKPLVLLPLVVAVLEQSGWVDEDDIGEALFGRTEWQWYQGDADSIHQVRKRNGYWRGNWSDDDPQRGTRGSAVLFGSNLRYWRIATGHAASMESTRGQPLPSTTTTALRKPLQLRLANLSAQKRHWPRPQYLVSSRTGRRSPRSDSATNSTTGAPSWSPRHSTLLPTARLRSGSAKLDTTR